MADHRSTDARGKAAEREQPAAPAAAPARPEPRDSDPPASKGEAEKARTEIAAGDVADDLADFA